MGREIKKGADQAASQCDTAHPRYSGYKMGIDRHRGREKDKPHVSSTEKNGQQLKTEPWMWRWIPLMGLARWSLKFVLATVALARVQYFGRVFPLYE